MNPANTTPRSQFQHLLDALQAAIVTDSAWRYESLVNQALTAGATDDDIDMAAREAMAMLLSRAEQPLTARDLARSCTR